MVHYMDHDYIRQNINEYMIDVYIYKHTAKHRYLTYKKMYVYIYIFKPLCMVYIILHIVFYIENEHTVFDTIVNMVDNSKHKVIYKPKYNKLK